MLATPQDAARSVLTCLRAQRAARLRRDQEAVERYQAQLRSAAARDVIVKRRRELFRRPTKNVEQMLDTFVRGWGPIIGFYADGLRLAQLQVSAPSADADRVQVRVPAARSAGSAVLRLECYRGSDRKWRVARIDFAAPRARSQPTSAPGP